MIKIAHLITETNTGGAETMLCRLVSRMSPAFKNIVISMTDKGNVGRRIASSGISVYTLNSKRGNLGIFAFLKLIRILSKEKPHILHTWLYHADFFGLCAGKITGIKSIIWNIRCSCIDFKRFSILKKAGLRLLAWLSKIPQVVVFNSSAGMAAHKRIGYSACHSTLINNGFELDKFYPEAGKKDILKKKLFGTNNLIVIGSISRFDPLKDHETFLKAIEIFKKKYTGIDIVKFVLVGSGMTENQFISNLITSLGIETSVTLLGEREDIADLISSFDVYCSSSISEGFPNVIGEAMACGVPCVATNAGDSALLIDTAGIIVPIKDPDSLATGWLKMIAMGNDEREKLGMLGRKRIESYFSIQRIAGQYEALFSNLIN